MLRLRSVVLVLGLAAMVSVGWTAGMSSAEGAQSRVSPTCIYCPAQVPVIEVSRSTVVAGQLLTLAGKQFTPNGSVKLSLHSAPVSLGTLTADSNGAFSAEVTIPAKTPTGRHEIVAVDGPTHDVAAASITVVASGGAPGGGAPGGGGVAGTGVAIAGLGGLGGTLVVLGGVLVVVGRRRRSRTG